MSRKVIILATFYIWIPQLFGQGNKVDCGPLNALELYVLEFKVLEKREQYRESIRYFDLYPKGYYDPYLILIKAVLIHRDSAVYKSESQIKQVSVITFKSGSFNLVPGEKYIGVFSNGFCYNYLVLNRLVRKLPLNCIPEGQWYHFTGNTTFFRRGKLIKFPSPLCE